MRLFNSFQFVVLFAAWPFIIDWLGNASFAGHSAMWYAAVVAYLVQFAFSVGLTHDSISRMEK